VKKPSQRFATGEKPGSRYASKWPRIVFSVLKNMLMIEAKNLYLNFPPKTQSYPYILITMKTMRAHTKEGSG
jgi:hypothetical protein